MTKEDIDNIISIICPNDEDFEKPIISPAYLKKELEALALEQEPCEDAIGRSDMLDVIGHGTTYTSEELQKIIKALPSVNPQPCEELDFVQPHKKFPVNLEACKMREATQEEREGIEQYIDSISIAESCEDAISREDALMCLTGEIKETDTIETIIARVVRRIRKLPPVTPQPKTGHWRAVYQGDEIINYRCSECELGDTNGSTNLYGWDYCRRCGAKMNESQESEDKE